MAIGWGWVPDTLIDVAVVRIPVIFRIRHDPQAVRRTDSHLNIVAPVEDSRHKVSALDVGTALGIRSLAGVDVEAGAETNTDDARAARLLTLVSRDAPAWGALAQASRNYTKIRLSLVAVDFVASAGCRTAQIAVEVEVAAEVVAAAAEGTGVGGEVDRRHFLEIHRRVAEEVLDHHNSSSA